ncbi:Hypothetical protein FKW44_021010 [Caligus rogercresseyi]|uniref:Uncharacterized protein n=1 Tax=Caligus rogercresseyi TaxID=217165 RepID=A0A7T8GR88_CALRO|nr:Hypothetical protein FKW44_021010 [Caligus rogercresseyi]
MMFCSSFIHGFLFAERGFEDHQNDLIGGGGYSHQISGALKALISAKKPRIRTASLTNAVKPMRKIMPWTQSLPRRADTPPPTAPDGTPMSLNR